MRYSLMRHRKYMATLKHDNGKFRLWSWAADKADFIAIVMRAEGCPRRAIRKIKRLE